MNKKLNRNWKLRTAKFDEKMQNTNLRRGNLEKLNHSNLRLVTFMIRGLNSQTKRHLSITEYRVEDSIN